MTDEEVLKAMKTHMRATGMWPRAEALISETGHTSTELKNKIDTMIEHGFVSLGLDGRYRITHPSVGEPHA